MRPGAGREAHDVGRPRVCGWARPPRTLARGARGLPRPFPRARPAPKLAVPSLTASCTSMSAQGASDKLSSTSDSHDTLSTQFRSVTAFKGRVLASFSSLY